jgi:apolipoprotein N-acyltransferase
MKYYFYTIDLNRTGATTKKINKVYFNIDNNKKFTQKEFENENKIYFNSEEFEKSESKKIIKNITKEKILSFLLDKKSDTILIIKNNSKKNIKELIKDYNKNPLTVLTNFIFEVK